MVIIQIRVDHIMFVKMIISSLIGMTNIGSFVHKRSVEINFHGEN